MPRIIEPELCIACGACEYECPVACITHGPSYVIDANVCIDCGKCQKVCTSQAIFVLGKDIIPTIPS